MCSEILLIQSKFAILHFFLLSPLLSGPEASRKQYKLDNVKLQNFSLPYNYMLYNADNPSSSTSLEKLQKTCKYFFSRKQILIVDRFYFNHDEKDYYAMHKKHWKTVDRFSYSKYRVSMEKLPSNALFWLTKNLEYSYQSFGELALPKIYASSLRKIEFQNLDLTDADFEKLAFSGKLEKLELLDVKIVSSNDEKWTWLGVYQQLPYLRSFEYDSSEETTDVQTIQKLNTIERKAKLQSFKLALTVSSPFTDILCLWKFMKDNACPPVTKKRNGHEYTSKSRFEFYLRTADLETNYSKIGNLSLNYEIDLTAYPYIIPNYDENEFFQNGVIQRLV